MIKWFITWLSSTQCPCLMCRANRSEAIAVEGFGCCKCRGKGCPTPNVCGVL